MSTLDDNMIRYRNTRPAIVQEKVLRFIADYIDTHNKRRPTYREIGEAIGCHRTRAHAHVTSLFVRGALIEIDDRHVEIADWIDFSLEHPLQPPNPEDKLLKFDKDRQFKNQAGRCYYCGKEFPNGKYHIDHVIPRSRGGTDYSDNKVLACSKCNIDKSDRLPHEWIEGGRLL